jgi:lambda repressor-like predicted transcriptional regulator
MPKLKDSPEVTAEKHLVALIEGRSSFYGVTRRQLARAVGITESTLRSRLRNPREFKYQELLAVAKKLHFEAQDVCLFLGVSYSPVVIAGEQYIIRQ